MQRTEHADQCEDEQDKHDFSDGVERQRPKRFAIRAANMLTPPIVFELVRKMKETLRR